MLQGAVGTAIGSNPVAFIIPCHRVIQASGLVGVLGGALRPEKSDYCWEASRIHLKINNLQQLKSPIINLFIIF
jgi:AraC family transcriptional regulator of adaptative response/methylated-DNA-[protein]-cysteine methyltransferase